ncbi:MAG: hydrogenase accessory protein HypB [Legionellales bacterium RIFCSPHIGHO2_12_FULL_42_9]|nr:MAG: hydrogenase accessory protein HypB [Legionellales bacterium RIFCSPHIGHO2_12_FULL_42_9]
MCGICGCSDDSTTHHEHRMAKTMHQHENHNVIQIEQDLLAKNNQYARENRDYFLKEKITAINLMSSPGSGKTTLLARTFTDRQQDMDMTVIVGDQQTDQDAQKLQSAGLHAVQINTGKVCHLDAHMVGHSIEHVSHQHQGILFIENVGNLVCPALFDLGEAFRVVLLSVTEGDNKPLKYPDMFRASDLMLLTKIDLLPYVEFNTNKAIEYAQRINPSIHALSLSATTSVGLKEWYLWLKNASKKITHVH